jgi:hypothetical protein
MVAELVCDGHQQQRTGSRSIGTAHGLLLLLSLPSDGVKFAQNHQASQVVKEEAREVREEGGRERGGREREGVSWPLFILRIEFSSKESIGHLTGGKSRRRKDQEWERGETMTAGKNKGLRLAGDLPHLLGSGWRHFNGLPTSHWANWRKLTSRLICGEVMREERGERGPGHGRRDCGWA